MSGKPNEVVELEMKLAFLERTVEVQNEVILEQGAELQSLTARLARLETRAKADESGAAEGLRPHDDPPPHY
ncbi:MAG: SlyX family protein [Planctomycetota bacterium]|nr:SlyX family protein [Planctomycetota bacterium]MDG2142734.1 SlyX family protein [Planctomycetota bacterium]